MILAVSSDTITIPLVVTVLVSAMLWIIIGYHTKGHWAVKSLFVVLTYIVVAMLWVAIDDFFGWASTKMPKNDFKLEGVVIEEPSSRNEDGFITMAIRPTGEGWQNSGISINEISGYQPDQYEPKLIKMPYNEETAEHFRMLQGRLMKGIPVFGRMVKKKGGGLPGNNGKDGKGKLGERDTPSFEFHEVPPPNMVPKSISN